MTDPARLASALDAWEQAPAALRRLRARVDTRTVSALSRGEAALAGELRRRLGPAPTLGDLSESYRDAEAWARDVVADALEPIVLPEALAPLLDAAYARLAASVRTRSGGQGAGRARRPGADSG